MEATGGNNATDRFNNELRAFLASALLMQEPAIAKVTDLTVNEHKRVIKRSNLDDLNDIAKTYFFTEVPPT